MALSNWDAFAMTEKGEASFGEITSPLGITVRIYKNWLYVEDPKVWYEGSRFSEPTIMQIESGLTTYGDLTIYAERGPQEGIYAIIHTKLYPLKDGQFLVGCGVYGFDESKWVGVKEESRNHLREILNQYIYDRAAEGQYIEAQNVDWSQMSRFNQGDRFFAQESGDVQFTPVGQAQPPILIQMINHVTSRGEQ